MNPREKTLAVVVVALLGLLGLRMIHNRIEDKVTQKKEDLTAVQSRLDSLLDELETAKRANTKLEQWRSRSLPSDEDVARSNYQQWIGDQLSNAGMENIGITTQISKASARSAYGMLTVTVNADGSLDSLIQFLFTFYRADLMHKIRSLTSNPNTTDKRMTLTMSVEALILPEAHNTDTLPEGISSRLRYDDMAAYQKSIGNRNLFTAYQPPPPSKPPAVRIATPDPPPKPIFDDATQAYVTGIVERGGQLEAWINVRTTGEFLRLNKGEPFDIGLMNGHVVDVTSQAILLETEDGLVQVDFGQPLRNGKPVEASKGS